MRALAARDAIDIDITDLIRVHAAEHGAVHRHGLVFLRFFDDGKAGDGKGAERGQFRGRAQLERVQAGRAIGVDLEACQHVVFGESAMNGAALGGK